MEGQSSGVTISTCAPPPTKQLEEHLEEWLVLRWVSLWELQWVSLWEDQLDLRQVPQLPQPAAHPTHHQSCLGCHDDAGFESGHRLETFDGKESSHHLHNGNFFDLHEL